MRPCYWFHNGFTFENRTKSDLGGAFGKNRRFELWSGLSWIWNWQCWIWNGLGPTWTEKGIESHDAYF